MLRNVAGLVGAVNAMRRGLELEVLPSLTPLSRAGVYSWNDVAYKGGADVDVLPKQCLDVYVPSEPFPRPLLPVALFVHGGGWQRGDKQHHLNCYSNVGIGCAGAGAVGVVMNYRLAPDVRHPEQVRDVASAVAWVHANIDQFGGDPNSIVLCGHSAGAHLCMLAAAQPRWLAEAGVSDVGCLRGVVGISGVYNLPRLAHTPLGPYLVEPAFGSDEDDWRDASPVHHTGPHSGLHDLPLLLLNADSDFHLRQDTEEFVERLQRHRPATATSPPLAHGIIQDSNHATIIAAFGQPDDDTTARVTEFIGQVAGSQHKDAK